MIDTNSDESACLDGAPLDLKNLLAIFFNRCKKEAFILLVLLSKVEKMDVMVVTHVRCCKVSSIRTER